MTISKKLIKYSKADNIVPLILKEDQGDLLLCQIASDCLKGLEEDKRSMKDWLKQADQAMDLAGLKEEVKNYPFSKAANVKFPLITTAVLQYTSRTLSEMIKDGKVCNYKVQGRDPAQLKARRGQRRCLHMNWQIMDKIPRWMDNNEKLLQQWAVVGSAFKKTWYDPCIKCPRSEMIPYDQLIINYNETSLEDVARITQYLYMSKKKLIEYQRYGLYDNMDDLDSLTMDSDDTDSINHELIEQHCFLDLDEDDYPEPYIVTIHLASAKVFRIVSRFEEQDIELNSDGDIQKIKAMNYYTLYTFLPSLDGSLFGMGLGTMLAGTNKAANTALNALINSGHLATMQGGFLGKGLKIQKKDLQLDPGEWITVPASDGSSLKDNIVPFNYKEPSQVLFQLVEYLIESAKTLSASTDVMTGTSDTTNVSPNTLTSLIQQSLTTYVPIQRRFFRGVKEELLKLAMLNQRYLDVLEYVNLIDPSEEEMKEMFDEKTGQLIDYELDQVDVTSVVDLNESTKQEALMKAQALNAFLTPFVPLGAVNVQNLIAFTCRSMEIDPEIYQNIIKEAAPPPPDPKLLEIDRKSKKDQADMMIKAAQVQSKGSLEQAKVIETHSKALKLATDADNAEAKTKLDVINSNAQDEQFHAELDHKDRALKVQLAQSAMKMTTDTHSNNIKATSDHNKSALEHRKLDREAIIAVKPVDISPSIPSKSDVINAAKARGFQIHHPSENDNSTPSGPPSKEEILKMAKKRGFKIKGENE